MMRRRLVLLVVLVGSLIAGASQAFLAPAMSLSTARPQETPQERQPRQQIGRVTDINQPIDLSVPSESVDWAKIAPAPGEKGGVDVAGPYQVANWPRELHADYSWGHTDG